MVNKISAIGTEIDKILRTHRHLIQPSYTNTFTRTYTNTYKMCSLQIQASPQCVQRSQFVYISHRCSMISVSAIQYVQTFFSDPDKTHISTEHQHSVHTVYLFSFSASVDVECIY